MKTEYLANKRLKLHDIQFVPAAIYYPNHGGFGVYVRWRGHGQRTGTRVLSASSWNIHLQLPDREIFLAGNLNEQTASFSHDWDEFVPISIFHEAATNSKGRGPSSFMVNAHQNRMALHRSHNTRNENTVPSKTIFGDSGGFQLRRSSEFIDPVSVANFYNNNVDYGIVLDFPLLDNTIDYNLETSASIQRMNIDIMKRNLESRVKLVNVAHGHNFVSRLKFLDQVHDDSIRSVAISKTTHDSGIISFIYELKKFIDGLKERYDDHYNHLHLLGLAENRIYLPVMRMAALGLFGNIRITMDSSTPIQLATSKMYFHHNHSMSNYTALKIGNDFNFLNPEMRLPCSCPLCSAFGWMDAFTVLSTNSSVAFPLMYHNIFASDAYFRSINWFAANTESMDLRTMTDKWFGTNKHVRNEMRSGITFIDEIVEDGIDVAAKRYNYFLDTTKDGWEGYSNAAHGLFDGVVMTDTSELEALGHEPFDDYGSLKPHHVIDEERMDLFKRRFASLNDKMQNKLNNDGPKKPKRPSKLNVDSPKPKGKRKKVEIKDEPIKVITGVKARSGPNKNSLKAKPKKPRNDGKVLGKVVIKSKNKKRI